MIAYWIYASFQAIVVVTLFEVEGDAKRMVSLGFLTLTAPAVTVGLAYVGMGKLLEWLQVKT